MFFFDPERGPERRARIRDASQRILNEAREALQSVKGELEGGGGGEVSEEELINRVRSKLARVTPHADAIQVRLKEGNEIELKGPVLASEHDRVVRAASRVPGVESIDDDLVVYDRADGVMGLEGEGRRSSGMGGIGMSKPESKVLLGASILAILPLVPALLKTLVFAAMRSVVHEAGPQVMRRVSEGTGVRSEERGGRNRERRDERGAAANPT
ncbi:MAG: hypothetical protein JWP87_3301 [Labilithrix sp.]|nr:hypothetical protein [Labilithrix sp.]